MYIKWLTYHVYKTSLQACWQNVWKYSPLKNVSVLFVVCHNRYYQQEITFKAIPNVILPVFFSHPYTAAVEEHSVAVTAVWCRKCAMILQKEKTRQKLNFLFHLSADIFTPTPTQHPWYVRAHTKYRYVEYSPFCAGTHSFTTLVLIHTQTHTVPNSSALFFHFPQHAP